MTTVNVSEDIKIRKSRHYHQKSKNNKKDYAMTDIKTLFEKAKDDKDPEFQARVDEILQEYEVTKEAIDKLYGSTDLISATDFSASSISNLVSSPGEDKNAETAGMKKNADEVVGSNAVEKGGDEIEVESEGTVIRVAGLTSEDAKVLNEHRALRKMTTLLQDTYDDLERKTRFVAGDKIYPNEPCPCGSGKKYKKCCGRKELSWEERKALIIN